MKTLASVLACLCVVLAVACVSLIATRPSAASAAVDDKPAAPQVGRYNQYMSGASLYLLDTATGKVWKEDRAGWVAAVQPVKEDKP